MTEDKKHTEEKRLNIIEQACRQIGKGAFYSTIIIVASFLPVFLLTGQEGKLFSPLAWTKTFILLIDAFIAVTLVPVLISFFLKGKLENARHFLESLRVFSLAESLGGVESLVDHPAIMTHASIPAETRRELGITETLVRLSIGIENVADLRDDLDNALKKSMR